MAIQDAGLEACLAFAYKVNVRVACVGIRHHSRADGCFAHLCLLWAFTAIGVSENDFDVSIFMGPGLTAFRGVVRGILERQRE